MISDEDFDALRRVADDVRHDADTAVYGYFCGGDPRLFTPDFEVCSAEELEAHKTACAAWDRGECEDVGGPRQPLTEDDIAVLREMTGRDIAGGTKTIAHYGMGMQVFADATLLKLAQDLDDWIDRARQVVT
jgi:hypothetical protein